MNEYQLKKEVVPYNILKLLEAVQEYKYTK